MAKRKTSSAEAPSFARYAVNFPRGLNVRSGPGREHNVLRVLKDGEEVEATGDTLRGWLPVPGGWVDMQYLREV